MSDKYNQKWVSHLFRRPRWAITLFGTAYFSVPESEVGAAWHRHEDEHKRQQAAEPVAFYFKYLWQVIRYKYADRPYEAAAIKAEEI